MISGSCQQAALLSAPQLWWAHTEPVYLCLSRRRAGSEVHIPVSCHRNTEKPKQLFLTKHSLTVLTQTKRCWLHWQCPADPNPASSWGLHPCPCKELGQDAAGQVTQDTAVGFTLLAPCPPPPSAGLSQFSTFLLCLQFCWTPNQQEDVGTGGTQVCSSLGSRGWNGAWSFVHPRPGLQDCQSLTPVHGGTGGVNGGANQDPWCPGAPGPLVHPETGCNRNRGEALL